MKNSIKPLDATDFITYIARNSIFKDIVVCTFDQKTFMVNFSIIKHEFTEEEVIDMYAVFKTYGQFIQSVNFSSNNLQESNPLNSTKKMIQIISDWVEGKDKLNKLTALNLSHNQLNAESLEFLGTALKNTKTIETLNSKIKT